MANESTSNGHSELLARVEQALPGMSKSEKKIGQELLREPLKFANLSVRELANDIGVSEPTVIRFCRTIGCDGFKDMKFRIAQELAVIQALRDSQAGASATHRKREIDAAPSGPFDLREQVLRSAIDALAQARDSFEATHLDRASQAIVKANRVMVYGVGGSSAILASELHNRLFRLCVPSTAFADSYQLRMSAATLTRDDVAVFISSTGRPRALQDGLELAKYYGATSIGITAADSLLGKEVDICLDVTLSQSGVDEAQPNPMRFAQLYVVDCLAFRVALDLGEKAHTALRRTRASVASLHGIASQQPIGD